MTTYIGFGVIVVANALISIYAYRHRGDARRDEHGWCLTMKPKRPWTPGDEPNRAEP
jgi:hypothetical protein